MNYREALKKKLTNFDFKFIPLTKEERYRRLFSLIEGEVRNFLNSEASYIVLNSVNFDEYDFEEEEIVADARRILKELNLEGALEFAIDDNHEMKIYVVHDFKLKVWEEFS